jgi:hypothetical protein
MATKSGTKKGGAKKGGEKKGVAATASLAGACLSFSRAGRIVQECSNGPHDIDDTLEEVGLITDNQRLVFRECVFQKVLEHGCKISREDIPNEADNTLREVRDTIADKAA